MAGGGVPPHWVTGFWRVRTAAVSPTAGGMSSEVVNARRLAARNFARPDRGPGTDVLSGCQGPSNGGARRRNVVVAGLTFGGNDQSDSVNLIL